MQVLAFMRYYTVWSARLSVILEKLEEVIYLTDLTEKITDFGKSEF